MINKDNLVEGPFGGDACYEQVFTQDGNGCVSVVDLVHQP